MSTEISLNVTTSFVRTLKSGKTQTRGVLGAVMSGNKDERGLLSRAIGHQLIQNNTYTPVMTEIVRVFAPASLLKHGVFKIAEDFAIMRNKSISLIDGAWDKNTAAAYCEAVCLKVAALEDKGTYLKGERSMAAEFAETLRDHIQAKEAAIAAEQKAAALATPATTE